MHASIYETITQRIIQTLESGVVPWHRPWTVCAIPPANLVSRRPYRGINTLVTRCAEYASPWWLSFLQVQSLGGHIRKGEHGTPIVFFKRLDGKPQGGAGDENEAADTSAGWERRCVLRYTHVFNVLQTDGIEEGKIPAVPVTSVPADNRAEALLTDWTHAPTIRFGFNGAAYRPRTDTINMPLRDNFENTAAYYLTLWHECAHATGHPTRLGRFSLDAELAPFGSPTYSREELIAEMAAAFICGELQLDSEIESSAAYLDHWLGVLRSDRRQLVQVAAEAQRAVDYIHGTTDVQGDPSMNTSCSHTWINPNDPPIQRAPYAPVIGALRHQMKEGDIYRCCNCGAVLQTSA